MNNKVIAITIGDIKGIGIQILINSWNKNKIKNFILFTNINILEKYVKNKKILSKINLIDSKNINIKFNKNKFNVFSFSANSLEDNTYKSLNLAYDFCKRKFCIGVITLPIRKDLIISKIDKKFIGQTEYFQKKDKKKYSNMILYNRKIIITPITTHIKISDLPKLISNKKYIYKQIINLNNTLKVDFNIKKPKLIISGLNPHSGENGNIGKEEINTIIPTIIKLNKNGINIDGPYSADSMLIKKNLKFYNCFIFLFHDQALIPFKYISQFTGVNYTGNLNIIRTSPDHGTAYNLIGKKNISDKSFINCYKLIKKIYNNRKLNAKS